MPNNSTSKNAKKRIEFKDLTAVETDLTANDMKKVRGGTDPFAALQNATGPNQPQTQLKLASLSQSLSQGIRDVKK